MLSRFLSHSAMRIGNVSGNQIRGSIEESELRSSGAIIGLLSFFLVVQYILANAVQFLRWAKAGPL